MSAFIHRRTDWRVGESLESGVSFWKKVEYSIDIGSVADMTEFEFKIEIFFYPFNLKGKGRTIRKVINNRTDTG
jgi:hypothetical protein